MLWTLYSVFHSAPAEGPLLTFAMKLVFFRRTAHLVRYLSGITAGTWSSLCVFGGFAVRSAHCARLFLTVVRFRAQLCVPFDRRCGQFRAGGRESDAREAREARQQSWGKRLLPHNVAEPGLNRGSGRRIGASRVFGLFFQNRFKGHATVVVARFRVPWSRPV